MPNHDRRSEHVRGVDSIRFLSALWVFFGHGAAPEVPHLFPADSLIDIALRGVYNNIWNGPAAVIVFFVISGFCIHFPFAGSDRRPQLAEFYTRRFVRILLPVLAIVPLGSLVGVELTILNVSILWSLLAEMIYYAGYPLLRAVQLRLGSWRRLIVVAFIAGFAVAATDPFVSGYPMFGVGLNWLLGLPCWVLGCAVAEALRGPRIAPTVTYASLNYWRVAVLGAAWAASVLRFHMSIGAPWTLNLFAILVAAWLYREVVFRRQSPPSRALEWAGLWSYSLYLVHVPALAAFELWIPRVQSPLDWLAMLSVVFGASYVFYFLVEKPSHILARWCAAKVSARRASQRGVIRSSESPART